jgi:hypothetical protein
MPSRVRLDHRKEENPYLSRYGLDSWKDEIRKCSAMSGFICAMKMVHHMKEETERIIEGTSYKGHGQFYHDALTLMTCSKTKSNMQKNEFFKYWLLPLENLQAGTRYHNSIPGDSPELMPWDETLNMDIHSSARYHFAITAHLAKENKKKFTFSKKIRQAGGKIVEGFGRNGHWRGHEGKRGGHREKKDQGPAKWVHSDAAGITQHKWRESIAKVEDKLNSISTPSTITASATRNRQRPEINRTGTYAEKERERETTTAPATPSASTAASTAASRATNSAGTSPLTMLDFGSDI